MSARGLNSADAPSEEGRPESDCGRRVGHSSPPPRNGPVSKRSLACNAGTSREKRTARRDVGRAGRKGSRGGGTLRPPCRKQRPDTRARFQARSARDGKRQQRSLRAISEPVGAELRQGALVQGSSPAGPTIDRMAQPSRCRSRASAMASSRVSMRRDSVSRFRLQATTARTIRPWRIPPDLNFGSTRRSGHGLFARQRARAAPYRVSWRNPTRVAAPRSMISSGDIVVVWPADEGERR
jgi:hypothetical protein